MKSLADAEREFASMSVQEGYRKAFLANFADDGIAFQPHPVVYKDAMKDRPAPSNPKAYTLNWEPVFGDVSENGDLGYTTGPYSFVDNSGKRPPTFGFYFSVWKKDPTTPWRVALDIGIGTPKAFEGPKHFQQARAVKKTLPANEGPGKKGLEKTIGEYLSLAASKGVLSAYTNHLAAECRLHLEGHRPLVGKKSITEYFHGKKMTRSGAILFTAMSKSQDMGYAYGSYANSQNEKAIENGYFGHVWKRNKGGHWKLVAEILTPIPPEAP